MRARAAGVRTACAAISFRPRLLQTRRAAERFVHRCRASPAALDYNRACLSPTFSPKVNIEHLGFAAAACTTFSFVPQVLLVWRNRAASGISTGMYLLFITGIALWLWYGLMIGSMPVVIANALTLVLASSVLLMKWAFERTRPGSVR